MDSRFRGNDRKGISLFTVFKSDAMPLTLHIKPPPPCAECGYEPVFHGLERMSIIVDSVIDPLLWPIAKIGQFAVPTMESLADAAAPLCARVLTHIGLSTMLDVPDTRVNETTQCLWEEAKKRGIVMKEWRLFGLPRRLFIAKFRGRTIVFEGLPRLPRIQKSLAWIDNKAKLKKRFMREGFPVGRGGVCKNEKGAVRLFKRLRPPIVAKPHMGSGGRHTAVHIESEEDVRNAFLNARKLSPSVVLEEELYGPAVFRATLIAKKLVAVLRRDPPTVLGDGKRAIQELIEKENRNPLRKGPVFAYIPLENPMLEAELNRQGLGKNSIPRKGQRVPLHFKVNWGVGGTSHDVTEDVHPMNKQLFDDIGWCLGNDIVGIDFMIRDISVPWVTEDRCGVIECNGLPLIGNHHFPFTGPVRNVAGAVWDMVFPGSAEKKGQPDTTDYVAKK